MLFHKASLLPKERGFLFSHYEWLRSFALSSDLSDFFIDFIESHFWEFTSFCHSPNFFECSFCFCSYLRIPVDTRSLIPVISVHSISNLQYRRQS